MPAFAADCALPGEANLAKHLAMGTELFKPDPIYQRLAEEFSALIRRGQLKPGERLPSVRDRKSVV